MAILKVLANNLATLSTVSTATWGGDRVSQSAMPVGSKVTVST